MTAVTTSPVADRAPRLALGVAFKRTGTGGLASVGDVAAALDVMTSMLTRAPSVAPGPLQIPATDASSIDALAIAQYDGAPLIISAGDDGALRSWRPDGTPGPLTVDHAHHASIGALAVAEHDGAPLIISAGDDGALRSWRLDGTPGPLTVDHAHHASILALAVAEHDDAPLIISASYDRALRSWRLDGTPGPLTVDDAHHAWIRALAVAEHDGAPLIISAGRGRALRSWRLDGTPGPLTVDDAHHASILALAVAEHDGAALIISADGDGALRSWRISVPGDRLVGLQGPEAAHLEVRSISLASPLEVVLHLPYALAAIPAVVAGVLFAIRQIAGFPARLRIQGHQLAAEELEARAARFDAQVERNDASIRAAVSRSRRLAAELRAHNWEIIDAELSNADDEPA